MESQKSHSSYCILGTIQCVQGVDRHPNWSISMWNAESLHGSWKIFQIGGWPIFPLLPGYSMFTLFGWTVVSLSVEWGVPTVRKQYVYWVDQSFEQQRFIPVNGECSLCSWTRCTMIHAADQVRSQEKDRGGGGLPRGHIWHVLITCCVIKAILR